jgi:polysaccharide export outer membrane protein
VHVRYEFLGVGVIKLSNWTSSKEQYMEIFFSRSKLPALLPFFVIFLFALSGCTSSSVPASQLNTAATGPGPLYQIGPGDQLGIFVYGAPDLSVSSVPVRPDGRISMPLVPNIIATGKTSVQLGQEIAQRLSTYVKSPNVTVMVDSFHGPLNRQVRVIGDTAKPIAVPYVDHMTLLDVMVDTGGISKFAAGNDAYILRRVNGQEVKVPVEIGALLNRGDMSQNVQMQPGDVIVIPATLF